MHLSGSFQLNLGLSALANFQNSYDEFKWGDGSPLTSTNWAPGEPHRALNTTRVVSMYWDSDSGENGHSPGQWAGRVL